MIEGLRYKESGESASDTLAETPHRSVAAAEKLLTKIWQQTLGIKDIRPSDNFFELGGDSILIVKIVAEAANAGLQIEPAQFVDHPTIALLAPAAEWRDAEKGNSNEASS